MLGLIYLIGFMFFLIIMPIVFYWAEKTFQIFFLDQDNYLEANILQFLLVTTLGTLAALMWPVFIISILLVLIFNLFKSKLDKLIIAFNKKLNIK